MNRISFTVPLVPPSVNHYKVRTRRGFTYVTPEAMAFKSALGVFGRGQFVESRYFMVSIHITLGKGERGDVDNFPKLVMDGLAEMGAFRDLKGKIVSDAYVRCMCVMLDCDKRPEHGETSIVVEQLK
jgi:Holliday junction resolvase RusA-like endonuclease